jgi:hypothetical protein
LHPRGQGQTASISRQATVDESSTPSLTGDPTHEEWEAHDEWLADSCEHGGYLLSLFLCNITRVKNLRGFLRGLQGRPGPRFPMLLEKVLYNGTHKGFWLRSE